MSQAIFTKYLPATNFKPRRIKARISNGTVSIIRSVERLEELASSEKLYSVPFQNLPDYQQKEIIHELAAKILCGTLGWSGKLARGDTKRVTYLFSLKKKSKN